MPEVNFTLDDLGAGDEGEETFAGPLDTEQALHVEEEEYGFEELDGVEESLHCGRHGVYGCVTVSAWCELISRCCSVTYFVGASDRLMECQCCTFADGRIARQL